MLVILGRLYLHANPRRRLVVRRERKTARIRVAKVSDDGTVASCDLSATLGLWT
jgi:hypothetical protein